MRRLAACLALAVCPTLVGCPEWSRPDPARQAKAAPAPAAPSGASEAAPRAPAPPAPTAAALSTELEQLRAEVAGLGAGSPAAAWKAAADRLSDLEARVYAAQDRGAPADEEALVALLEALALLRDDLVSRTPG